MIAKHIDLVAIAFLLLAIAAFSGAKHVVVLTMAGPVHYFRMDDGRQVRMPEMPAMPQVPRMPRVPRIPVQRD